MLLRCNGTRKIGLLLVDSHEIMRVGERSMLDHAEYIHISGVQLTRMIALLLVS